MNGIKIKSRFVTAQWWKLKCRCFCYWWHRGCASFCVCVCECVCVCVCVTREKKKKKKTSDRPLEQLLSPVCVQCFTQTHKDMQSCILPTHTYVLLSLPTSPPFLLCVSSVVAGLTQPRRKPESQRSVLPTEDQKAHQLCFRLRTYKPKYVSSFKCWILEPQHLHTALCINSKPSPHLLSALIRPALTLHYSSLEILQGTTVLKYAFWRTSATSDASTRCPLPQYKSFPHLLSLAPL